MPSELGGGGGGAAASSTAPSPLLWSSNTSARDSAAPRGGYSAVLQDSGSLQVRNGGEVLWDSFWNPTDTMLPGMQIAVQTPAPAGRASNGRMLFTSWASETDPAPGRYALGLDPVGFDQAYIWRDGNAIFWRSGQWTGANFIGIPWRPLYMSGFIPVKDSLGPRYIYTATNTSSLQRIVVLPNGTDILYMVKKYTQE